MPPLSFARSLPLIKFRIRQTRFAFAASISLAARIAIHCRQFILSHAPGFRRAASTSVRRPGHSSAAGTAGTVGPGGLGSGTHVGRGVWRRAGPGHGVGRLPAAVPAAAPAPSGAGSRPARLSGHIGAGFTGIGIGVGHSGRRRQPPIVSAGAGHHATLRLHCRSSTSVARVARRHHIPAASLGHSLRTRSCRSAVQLVAAPPVRFPFASARRRFRSIRSRSPAPGHIPFARERLLLLPHRRLLAVPPPHSACRCHQVCRSGHTAFAVARSPSPGLSVVAGLFRVVSIYAATHQAAAALHQSLLFAFRAPRSFRSIPATAAEHPPFASPGPRCQ